MNTMIDGESLQGLRKTGVAVGGTLCTVGGFVADVLQPIAPFANYLLLLSIAVLVLSALLFFRGRRKWLGALALSLVASLVFGLITLFQQGEEAQDSGVFAAAVPAIASLQESLGIIDAKLDDIKDDTETIKASTERLEANTEAVLASLDDLRANLGKGAIIANPDSPEAHYHNVRVHELAGDYAAARRSYLEYFRADLPLLDPHLRFISFLKVQEGTAGARETYSIVTANSDSPIPAYARLLLRDPGQRVPGLEAYLVQYPEFAPVAYQLSLEFSQRLLGEQTLADKRRELAYIRDFQRIDEAGGLLRYMIDQALVSEWREDAEARRVALVSGAGGAVLENPVSLSWMPHNAGWNGTLQISEPVQDIRWNIKGETAPRSTGASGSNDPRTGQPAPRAFFTLPRNQQQVTIEIRYTDAGGAEQGPFEFSFEPERETRDSGRQMLEMTETAWVSFAEFDRQLLAYFSHLMVYRGSLSEIRYGVDRETPDKIFRFPAWKGSGMATIDEKTPTYTRVPRGTRFITVQLTYKNGERSPVVRFDRP